MSDSDSQNQQQFNLKKLPEEQQPHVKEILSKGKKILPTYDDQSLYGLYKRYYCVENIFLNELHIIAKRAKGDNDSDDRKKDQNWIKVGRQIKTKVNKTKYNFLEDKELLRRAELFIKNKKLAPERNENFAQREKREVQKKPQYKKRQYVELQQGTYNRSAYNQRPKQKFVQKVEDVKKESQHVTYQEKKVEPKKVESPVKEQKYKQKVEISNKIQQKTEQKPAPQQPRQSEQQKPETPQHPQHPSNHEEKKPHQPSYHEHQKQQAHKKEEHPKQLQHHVKQVEHPVKQAQHEEKKSHETHHKKHPQPVSHHEKQPVTQPQKEPSTHSIPTVQNFDPVVAGENFKQACNQNSFVLKFIQPQAYPQRISYIRTVDGGMKNVQIRVTGTTSNQGSQKGF